MFLQKANIYFCYWEFKQLLKANFSCCVSMYFFCVAKSIFVFTYNSLSVHSNTRSHSEGIRVIQAIHHTIQSTYTLTRTRIEQGFQGCSISGMLSTFALVQNHGNCACSSVCRSFIAGPVSISLIYHFSVRESQNKSSILCAIYSTTLKDNVDDISIISTNSFSHIRHQ